MLKLSSLMEIWLKCVIKVICLVVFCDLVEYLRFNTSDYLARVIEPNENQCEDSDEAKSRSVI